MQFGMTVHTTAISKKNPVCWPHLVCYFLKGFVHWHLHWAISDYSPHNTPYFVLYCTCLWYSLRGLAVTFLGITPRGWAYTMCIKRQRDTEGAVGTMCSVLKITKERNYTGTVFKWFLSSLCDGKRYNIHYMINIQYMINQSLKQLMEAERGPQHQLLSTCGGWTWQYRWCQWTRQLLSPLGGLGEGLAVMVWTG